jgi:hypothetical protein
VGYLVDLPKTDLIKPISKGRKFDQSGHNARCNDLKNIFAEKFSENIVSIFYSKLQLVLLKFDHNIGFRENRNFFRRKLAEIAENFDHNIDP